MSKINKDNKKRKLSGQAHGTVKLNVGGTKYEVSRSLLNRFEHSMLGKLISERWNEKKVTSFPKQQQEENDEEEIFIDRNGRRFEYVLNYMRDSTVELPLSIPRGQFIADLEYFALDYVDSEITLSASSPHEVFHSFAKSTKKRSQNLQWMGVLQWMLAASMVLVLGLQLKVSLGVDANNNSALSAEASYREWLAAKQAAQQKEGDLAVSIPASSATMEGNPKLPSWLLNYTAWHTQQRQRLTPDNWKDAGNKYLILTCLRTAKTCGGLSDRLQHIPGLLRLAERTNRLLLIYWEVPAPLEEFLLPNLPQKQKQSQTSRAGIDWRMPKWLIPEIFPANGEVGCAIIQKVETTAQEDKFPKARQQVVCIRSHMHHHGRLYYDGWRQPTEATFTQLYPDLWRFVFVPVPPIAQAVQQEMDRLSLKPGRFVMAHARALYGTHMRDTTWIQKLSRNAVSCAHRLAQRIVHANSDSSVKNNNDKIPIFFASDSALAIETALQWGNGTVVTAAKPGGKQPLHLDRANSTTASDYYDIFVDLYLLGNSRCATFNVGGFGRWGALMGHAFSNRTNYTTTSTGSSNNNKHDDNDVRHLEDNLMEPCWLSHNKRDCIDTEA